MSDQPQEWTPHWERVGNIDYYVPQATCDKHNAALAAANEHLMRSQHNHFEAVQELIAERKKTKRDGKWLDSTGCCKVCDGEIPHGHTNNCDIWKLEQQLTVELEERDKWWRERTSSERVLKLEQQLAAEQKETARLRLEIERLVSDSLPLGGELV